MRASDFLFFTRIDFKPLSRYNAAVYWATYTITGIGFGDLAPRNAAEQNIAPLELLIRL